MLIVLGMTSGLLTGAQLAGIWGLRKAERVGPELLLIALVLLPILYYWGAEAWGWPTPGSTAESFGLPGEPVERVPFAGLAVGTMVLTVAVLVRSGATRRLEEWSRRSE